LQSLLLTCAEVLSATQLLSANWIAFRHDFAIPIRPETGRLMEIRKPHNNESEKARHDQSNQDAYIVGARRVPLRPSHFRSIRRINPPSLCGEPLRFFLESHSFAEFPRFVVHKARSS
jgi:hypothetical protein